MNHNQNDELNKNENIDDDEIDEDDNDFYQETVTKIKSIRLKSAK